MGTVADMTQLDYAESWAWVHLLMETDPQRLALLRDYLAQLRRSGAAPSLIEGIQHSLPEPHDALARYVEFLHSRRL
jgi:hypothetical protein